MTPRKGEHTPWGPAQTVNKQAEGIWHVTTAGHGGIFVSAKRLAQMPEYARSTPYSGGGWFEEDLDWALPVWFFRSEFQHLIDAAKDTILGSYLNKIADKFLKTGSIDSIHQDAFSAAQTHAVACQDCLVPIVKDDEGNPGFLGEACSEGRTLLQAWLDAEKAFYPKTYTQDDSRSLASWKRPRAQSGLGFGRGECGRSVTSPAKPNRE